MNKPVCIAVMRTHSVLIPSPTDHFQAHTGRDIWHKEKEVIIRLEETGEITVATENGLKTINFDELHEAISKLV